MKQPLRLLAIMLLTASSHAAAANMCGELTNGNGPFDYRLGRSSLASNLHTVESFHFNSAVAEGVKGMTGSIGADLDYTLRAFPNHSRALTAMARVALREKGVMLRGAQYPVECYFDRAIRFAPDDGAVRAIYGNYLFALGQLDTALAMFSSAVALLPDDPTVNYNAGLAYFKAKDYPKAVERAQKAYSLGFPLPGLRNKLVAAGKWDGKTGAEPPAPVPQAQDQQDKPAGDKAESTE